MDTTAGLRGTGEAAATSFSMNRGAHSGSASNSDSSRAFAASGPAFSALRASTVYSARFFASNCAHQSESRSAPASSRTRSSDAASSTQ